MRTTWNEDECVERLLDMTLADSLEALAQDVEMERNQKRMEQDVSLTDALPGGDLVRRGLADIAAGITSDESLLVGIGAPRLRTLGLDVPLDLPADPENELYSRLAATDSDSAHARYNALIRLLVSFERSYRFAVR